MILDVEDGCFPEYLEDRMTEESKKKTSRRPLLVYLLTCTGLILFSTILFLLDASSLSTIGTYFLYSGIIVAVIGFAFINQGGNSRGSGLAQSMYLKNTEYFSRVRKEEKPFEQLAWAVILAGISIAVMGYFLNNSLIE